METPAGPVAVRAYQVMGIGQPAIVCYNRSMEPDRRRVNVKDIPGDERRSLEHILGRKLQESEQVYIMAYTPGLVPDEETRRRARERLLELCKKGGEHAGRQGVSQQDLDATADEAMEHVRYGKP